MVSQGFAPQNKNPDYPSFDSSRPEAVADYLVHRNLLSSGEVITGLEPAGTGSRNTTIRVITSERSLILKQFREWAPNGCRAPPASERFRAECQFHRATRIAGVMTEGVPELLQHDSRLGCIVYEDLGPGRRTRGRIGAEQARALAWLLVSLHHRSQSVPAVARYRSEALIDWHVTSLFPGAVADRPGHEWRDRLVRQRPRVRRALEDARASLREKAGCLVHGDFVPGNWILAVRQQRVLDAEGSFFGRPELDVGIFLAGLLLQGRATEAVRAAVEVLAGACLRYDQRLTAAFAAAGLSVWLDQAHAASVRTASILIQRAIAAVEAGSLDLLAMDRGRITPAARG